MFSGLFIKKIIKKINSLKENWNIMKKEQDRIKRQHDEMKEAMGK